MLAIDEDDTGFQKLSPNFTDGVELLQLNVSIVIVNNTCLVI